VKNIYKHSNFSPDIFGHGGNKRTAQINELLINANINFREAKFSPFVPAGKNFLLYLKGIIYNRDLKAGFKNNYAIGRYIRQFETYVKNIRPNFFILESTSEYNILLFEVLHNNNIPIIALPHNIESLAYGFKSSFSNLKSPRWLFEELRYLEYCKKIFSISREEHWLLSCTGLNASYLPYFPTFELERYLLKIRSQKQFIEKKKNQNKKILLLGTFYNKPTLNGYIELIKNLKNYNDFEIIVAGFGAEKLNGMFVEKNVEVLGSVKNERLKNLIIECDYGIIHQEPSSGSLTRIPELLLAGLPLILNVHAARSNFDIKGLKIYDSFTELKDMLSSFTPILPPVLERPIEEKLFINYLRTTLN